MVWFKILRALEQIVLADGHELNVCYSLNGLLNYRQSNIINLKVEN